jgi:hypothetical protein
MTGESAVRAKGTPELGVKCQTCDDWGDLVEDADGKPIVPAVPCPDCATPPRSQTSCRCNGTKTVTFIIPIEDAVLLDERPCPECQGPAGGAP